MTKSSRSARLRVLTLIVIVLASVIVTLWLLNRWRRSTPPVVTNQPSAAGPIEIISTSPSPTPSSTPLSSPSPSLPTVTPSPEPSPDSPSVSYVGKVGLIIPVAGVAANQLLDTFGDARSEGRVHDAIDITAPAGTPVLAVSDGEVARLFQSEQGGTTIYQFSPDKKLIFYYAHLQRYADGLAAGKVVRQGEVIAYVGDTGNAGPGNYHLHFSISVLSDPKRYWEGTNINPYPLLKQ